ncbi:hypothetical protein DL95DRAFT_527831 [Leptodontidium sp. 2 PMI_412]|nr:hypothetical protein DL95DRAFT_527831 [Leptodontidium sp. 2 PMI_412]
MDLASGVAGLLGLAGLTVQSASTLYTFCRKIPRVAREVEAIIDEVQWLSETLEAIQQVASDREMQNPSATTAGVIAKLRDQVARCTTDLEAWNASMAALQMEDGKWAKNAVKKLKLAADSGRFSETMLKISSHRGQLGVLVKLLTADLQMSASLDIQSIKLKVDNFKEKQVSSQQITVSHLEQIKSSMHAAAAFQTASLAETTKISKSTAKIHETLHEIHQSTRLQVEKLDATLAAIQRSLLKPSSKGSQSARIGRKSQKKGSRRCNTVDLEENEDQSMPEIFSELVQRTAGLSKVPAQVNKLVDLAVTVRYRHGEAYFEPFAVPDPQFKAASFETKLRMVKYLQDLRLLLWLLRRKEYFCSIGKREDQTPEWEHLVAAEGDPRSRVREAHVCWNCGNQKVPCSVPKSEGERCVRCKSLSKKQPSLTTQQLCWRSGFEDYEPTFLPEYICTHLCKRAIECLISVNIVETYDTVFTVEVSTKLAQAVELVQRSNVSVYILGLSMSEVSMTCNRHVEEMISNPQYSEQVTAQDASGFPRQILEIVCKYVAMNKDVPLLQNAMKLHAIHYFMCSRITFTDKSACELYKRLAPGATPQPYLLSRVLNRQIKCVMHKLQREITLEVLENLERSLHSKRKDYWGTLFCTILILCLCIENMQTVVDVFAVFGMAKMGDAAFWNRNQSPNACEELDDYPFWQITNLFHDIYSSHRDGRNGGRGEKAFNPLKMAANDGEMGLDMTTQIMVRLVYNSIVCNSWAEIVELSEKPRLIDLRYTEPHHIRVNNTGRLAAKFLRSFFPDLSIES